METTDLKWCHSRDGETYDRDLFDTRDAAITDAKKLYYAGGYGEFYIAQIDEYKPQIDVNVILEDLDNQVYDASGECEDDYSDTVSPKEAEKLETRLQAVFDEWAEETGNKPKFYTIVNEEIIRIDDYPEGEADGK